MPATANIVRGFIAGALAVALFHQGAYWVMKTGGMPLGGTAWNLSPAPQAFGMPSLMNLMFWGGLWGVVFALIHPAMPGGTPWLKGLLFGMVFPMLLGSWLIFAMIKGQPVLAGGDRTRLLIGFLLNGVAFGIGLGLIYTWIGGAGRVDHR